MNPFTMLLNVIILVVILGVAYKFSEEFLPSFRGKRGERIVSERLNKLDLNVYKVINDLLIPSKNGTAQIDHVVLSPFGVFVLETKHYDGWIFGAERDQYWTQQIYRRKSHFYNPILQNKGHIKALQEHLIQFAEIHYVPIVVFTGRGTLKTRTESEVIYPGEILRVISEHTSVTMSPEMVQKLYEHLLSIRILDKQAVKQHVTNVKQRVGEKHLMTNQGVCPQCGGSLRVIQGKYGPFKGCSNYPQCRYRVKVGS